MRPSSHPLRPIRTVLVICAVGCALLAVGAGRASAAASAADSTCWQKVLHDWFVDGQINGTYPPKCLNQAMGHLGPDAREYSSFQDEAHRALLADESWQRDHPHKKAIYTFGGPGKGGGGNGPPSLHPNTPTSGSSGPVTSPLFKQTQPSSPTSIPVPLIVLGGVAALLLLAAAASFAARRFQARRLQTAPAPAPHDQQRP